MIGWYEFQCPNCEVNCFVDHGDPTDITGFDPEGFQCWNCEKQYAINSEGDLEESNEDFLEADMNPALSSSDLEKLKYVIKDIKSDKPPGGLVEWLLKKLTGLS
jgi:hypothetical protein